MFIAKLTSHRSVILAMILVIAVGLMSVLRLIGGVAIGRKVIRENFQALGLPLAI
jgi:hypothetical protein